ncbi:TPA: hypothetical protein ACYLN4_000566 [Burkholderia lata]
MTTSKKLDKASRLIGPDGQRVFVSVACRDSMEPFEPGVMRNRMVAVKVNDSVYYRAGVDVDAAAEWALTQLKTHPSGFEAAARLAGVWAPGEIPTIHLMIVLISYAQAFEIRWNEIKPSSLQRAWAMGLLPFGQAPVWRSDEQGALEPSFSDRPSGDIHVIDPPPLSPELRTTLNALVLAGTGGHPVDPAMLNPFERAM